MPAASSHACDPTPGIPAHGPPVLVLRLRSWERQADLEGFMNFARKAALTIAAVTALALSMIAAETTLAQEKTVMVGGAAMYPSKNIVQNAVNSKDHTTLVTAVKAAGLVETLEGPGPFTVFAPTNEAFAMLPKGTVESLLKPENKATLTKLLTYHVVAGRLSASDIKKQIKAGNG